MNPTNQLTLHKYVHFHLLQSFNAIYSCVHIISRLNFSMVSKSDKRITFPVLVAVDRCINLSNVPEALCNRRGTGRPANCNLSTKQNAIRNMFARPIWQFKIQRQPILAFPAHRTVIWFIFYWIDPLDPGARLAGRYCVAGLCANECRRETCPVLTVGQCWLHKYRIDISKLWFSLLFTRTHPAS